MKCLHITMTYQIISLNTVLYVVIFIYAFLCDEFVASVQSTLLLTLYLLVAFFSRIFLHNYFDILNLIISIITFVAHFSLLWLEILNCLQTEVHYLAYSKYLLFLLHNYSRLLLLPKIGVCIVVFLRLNKLFFVEVHIQLDYVICLEQVKISFQGFILTCVSMSVESKDWLFSQLIFFTSVIFFSRAVFVERNILLLQNAVFLCSTYAYLHVILCYVMLFTFTCTLKTCL